MGESARVPSRRKEELLELSYRYALEHGLADLSLRPLAAAVGSSPRVLLFLFGTARWIAAQIGTGPVLGALVSGRVEQGPSLSVVIVAPFYA